MLNILQVVVPVLLMQIEVTSQQDGVPVLLLGFHDNPLGFNIWYVFKSTLLQYIH